LGVVSVVGTQSTGTQSTGTQSTGTQSTGTQSTSTQSTSTQLSLSIIISDLTRCTYAAQPTGLNYPFVPSVHVTHKQFI